MQVTAMCLPVIVETKMESNVHACTVMPEGIGTKNLSATPMAMDISSGTGLAPCSMAYICESYNSLPTHFNVKLKTAELLTGQPGAGAAASATAAPLVAAACKKCQRDQVMCFRDPSAEGGLACLRNMPLSVCTAFLTTACTPTSAAEKMQGAVAT